jgi:hypothetical protein
VTAFGSEFLTDPGSFPETVSGKPWGEHRRCLDLPGGPYLLRGLSAKQAELIDRVLMPACRGGPAPEGTGLETMVYRVEPSRFREIRISGWDYTLDLDANRDRLRIASLRCAALVPAHGESSAGLWTSVEDRWFEGVIENYLRVVVASRLLHRDGLLLHSAGSILDGFGYLFVGASGAGKSTLARKALAAGEPVLSDDLNAVVDITSRPTAAGLPFTGELRNRTLVEGPAPLRAILVLDKGSRASLRLLSAGEAAAAIVATAPFVNRGLDSFQILLGSAASLATRVPVARLTTARETGFEEITRLLEALQ